MIVGPLQDWLRDDCYPTQFRYAIMWRWEFLRRNRHYQKDWEEKVQPHYRDDSIGDSVDIKFFQEKYGVIFPLAPSHGGPMIWSDQAVRVVEMPAGAPWSTVSDDVVALVFRLREPLDAQLNRARQWLEARQSELKIAANSSKQHERNYSRYLRLLDAECAEVTQLKMAQIIFAEIADQTQGIQRVRDGLKAARKLRDSGYRKIE